MEKSKMTFVNEKISEEDRAKYGIKKAADRWVIDRENGIFFVYTGAADYGRLCFYDLNLNGSVVKIFTDEIIVDSVDASKIVNGMSDVTYIIEKIQIPEGLNLSDSKIKSLINELFKKSGRFGREDGAASVTVNFPEKFTKYQEKSSAGRVI